MSHNHRNDIHLYKLSRGVYARICYCFECGQGPHNDLFFALHNNNNSLLVILYSIRDLPLSVFNRSSNVNSISVRKRVPDASIVSLWNTVDSDRYTYVSIGDFSTHFIHCAFASSSLKSLTMESQCCVLEMMCLLRHFLVVYDQHTYVNIFSHSCLTKLHTLIPKNDHYYNAAF